MNAEQIEQLKAALDDGNQGTLYWKQKGSNSIFRVEKIELQSEGSSFIYFSDWNSPVRHFTLEFMDYEDFVLVRPVSDLFE